MHPDFRKFDGFALAVAVIFSLTASGHAQEFQVLLSFKGPVGGSLPNAGLTPDGGGHLYGTTEFGGSYGHGVVFSLTGSGTETVLYAFQGGRNDGKNPLAAVALDGNGDLFGTTYEGGAGTSGTVFKLAPDGTESILYAFKGGSDGANPGAEILLQGGDQYGTTVYGGDANCGGGIGCGVAFELTGGTETVLHAFHGGNDGSMPTSGLVADSGGNLYGVTGEGGGSTNCNGGCGTVYMLATDGTESVIYAFQGGTSDGADPVGDLLIDNAGNLIGATYVGGAHKFGTIFKVTPSGQETILYSFANGRDGGYPNGSLIEDDSGKLYGMTCQCADTKSYGNVFALAPDGTESVLHTFRGKSQGHYPLAGLTEVNGVFYGTTLLGGHSNAGTVFSLSP